MLGQSREASEMLSRSESEHEVIIAECETLAVQQAGDSDLLFVEVNVLDLGIDKISRRKKPPGRAQCIGGLEFARDHVRNQAVETLKVILIDDGQCNTARLHFGPERFGQIDGDVTPT